LIFLHVGVESPVIREGSAFVNETDPQQEIGFDLSLKLLRMLFLLGGLAVFAGLNSWFFWQIWEASGHTAVNLNEQAVYGASAVGGVLGTFFAGALGINVAKGGSRQRLDQTLLSDVWKGPVLAQLAIWLYAAVGAAALVTVFFNQDQSPESIKALASVFSGFALAVFIATFGLQAQRGAAAPAAQPDAQ
jgi:hypothetical protein